jgi:predicted membrane protein
MSENDKGKKQGNGIYLGSVGHGDKVRAHVFFWSPGVIAGLVITVIGLILLAGEFFPQLDVNIGDFWPLVLVFLGGSIMRRGDGAGAKFVGGVILLLGVGFLLESFVGLEFNLGRLWPLFLVALGLAMVWGTFGGGRAPGRQSTVILGGEEASTGDVVNRFVALGGAELKSDSRNFRGGSLSAIMGGIELDLRNASIAGDEAVLDTFALMGGVDIRVPEDWSVSGKVLPILGAFEDNTRTSRESGKPVKRLLVKGTAMMGGIEIKN